ncbi:hypothetical protein CY35_09G099300 [Sphagnum magellanicum]|nr:hypothetical protein CY35_09G099300 [Sphagnum magellanicum]
MDEAKHHHPAAAAGAGGVVEVDARAIMVQEVSAAAPASGDGENRGVVMSPSPLQKVPIFPKYDVKSMAQKVASHPVSIVWGLLTAVSEKARARPQGTTIVLCGSEHILGRTVKEEVCRIESLNVSGMHCTISRRVCDADGKVQPLNHEFSPGDRVMICIKDSSSNGTFVNNQKLQRNGAEVELQHGDIVSLVGPPEHEDVEEGGGAECKRSRGLGTGGPDGPVSLNDVRRLQRSNEELRQQLEAHTLATEKLRSDYRASEAVHDVELKEVRASITQKYAAQIDDMQVELSARANELEESAAMISHQQSTIEDLKQHLAVAAKSRLDAEEAIESHKGIIQELENRLEDERTQHSKDKAKAEAKSKADLDRVRIESAEELKHVLESAALQHKQQQDIILTLQESDKENRLAAENLRKKLDIERAAVVAAEEKGRRLEAQLQEERIHNVNSLNKLAEIEKDLQQACRVREDEKKAREVAERKVADLELEMEVVFRDLALERQRLQGARERILLRETQMRAFHSTAAEVATLQQKQQEQLAAMLRTLEDGDDEKMKGEADTPSTSPYTKAKVDSPKCTPERNSAATKVAVEDLHSRFGMLKQVDREAQSSHQRMAGDTSKINSTNKSFGDESPMRTDSLHSVGDKSAASSSEGGHKMKSPVQHAVYGNGGDKQEWSDGETQEEDGMRYTGFLAAAVMDTQIETIPITTETMVGESTACQSSVQCLSSNVSVLAEAGCTQLLDVEGTQGVWSGITSAIQAQCKKLHITGEPERQAASVMHEAEMVAYSPHINCEVPAHGNEHLIKDSKEQDNCDEETQKYDDNDIAEKADLPYDEGKGEDQHSTMIWEQTTDQMSPKMNMGILEEPVDQQLKVSENSRRMGAEEDGCSRMHKGEQQGSLWLGRRDLQLNDSANNETESQSRKEVESSQCAGDLRVSEVVGSWALYTPPATRGHAESSSNDDDADSMADETPRISEEGNQPDLASSQVDTNLLERAEARNPEHRHVAVNFPIADANIDDSQTSPTHSSMVNPEIRTLDGFRPWVAEVQSVVALPRNTSNFFPGFYNCHEVEEASCHESESREEGEIGNSAETKA